MRQAAAKTDRMSKQYDREEMRARHLEMDAKFGEQALRVAESAQERGSLASVTKRSNLERKQQ